MIGLNALACPLRPDAPLAGANALSLDSSGGTIATATKKAAVVLSSGSLDKPTAITAAQIQSAEHAVKDRRVSDIYTFAPFDLALAVPATIRLNLDKAPTADQHLAIARLDNQSIWQVLLGTTRQDTTLSASISALGRFAVIDVPADGQGCQLQERPDLFCAPRLCDRGAQRCVAPAVPVQPGAAAPRVVCVEVVLPTTPVVPGQAVALQAWANSSDGNRRDVTCLASWSTDDANVAVVDPNGLLQARQLGSTQVRAAYQDTLGRASLAVSPAIVGLQVSPPAAAVAAGSAVHFTAQATYRDHSTGDVSHSVAWSVSDPNLGLLSSGGDLNTLLPGHLTVVAALQGLQAQASVDVGPVSLQQLSFAPPSAALPAGHDLQATATGLYSDGSTADLTGSVVWSSDPNLIVSSDVSQPGRLFAVGQGNALVGASLSGVSAALPITVLPKQLEAILVEPPYPRAAANFALPMVALGRYSDGSLEDLTFQVTWTSHDNSVATVSNAAPTHGLAQPLQAGSVQIDATYGSQSGSQQLTVSGATLVDLAVSPEALVVPIGAPLVVQAMGHFSDDSVMDLTSQVTWSSDQPSLLAISNAAGTAGNANALAAGSVQVAASLAGVGGSQQITVSSATLDHLVVEASRPQMARHTQQPVYATGVYSDQTIYDLSGAASWQTDDAARAVVGGTPANGAALQALQGGPTLVTARYGGLDAHASVMVNDVVPLQLQIGIKRYNVLINDPTPFRTMARFADNTLQELSPAVLWSSDDPTAATLRNATGFQGVARPAPVASMTSINFGARWRHLTTGLPVFISDGGGTPTVALPPAVPLQPGTTRQLHCNAAYPDGSQENLAALAFWASSDANILQVGNGRRAGRLLARQPGSATISAAYGGQSPALVYTVTSANLVGLQVGPLLGNLVEGLILPLVVTGVYDDASTAVVSEQALWTSTEPDQVTVSLGAAQRGLLSIFQPVSSPTVQATVQGISHTVSLTSYPPALVRLTISPPYWSANGDTGDTRQFTATGFYNDTSTRDLTTQVTWSTSNENGARISNLPGSQGMVEVGPYTGITATLRAGFGTMSDTATINIYGS